MQTYDMVMVGVFAAATIFGAWKGMAWQIASLSSFVASYFVSLKFSAQLAPMLSTQEPWNRFFAMLVLYLATSMVIWILFRLVANAIDKVKLKDFDRQIGGLFGAAKGILLCTAITFFAVTLSAESRKTVLESKSGVYIAQFLDKATPVMPREAHEVLAPYLERLDRGLDPNYHPEQDPRPVQAQGEIPLRY